MHLIVYGSFTCPYSYLASLRADRLTGSGAATLEWRAVVHDPEVPAEGVLISGDTAHELDRELKEIRGLLCADERYPARRPHVNSNPTPAVAGYATLEGTNADRLRAALFDAFWVDGFDIGDRATLERLGCPLESPGETMHQWQSEWEGFERRVVPMMVLPDGRLSRGLGALARLAEMCPIGGGGSSTRAGA